jgi:Domain of unknown function (DUF222)/HNH endonuclease
MVALGGHLDPEAGQTLLAALEPLARPAGAEDERSGDQRNADALAELARRSLQAGSLPRSGGVRPQLLVTVDLASLLGHDSSLGGELGWVGSLPAEAARRLACDAALTRVLVTRQQPNNHNGRQVTGGQNGNGCQQQLDGSGWDNASGDPTRDGSRNQWNGNSENGDSEAGNGAGGLAGRLRAAIRLLPPALGGAPTQPLEVGRTTRTVAPAPQRNALVVRDGGCAFPGCDRPQDWCEAHHLRHWAHGGPTDLANLALLCRPTTEPSTRAAGSSNATRRPSDRHPTTPTTTHRRLSHRTVTPATDRPGRKSEEGRSRSSPAPLALAAPDGGNRSVN